MPGKNSISNAHNKASLLALAEWHSPAEAPEVRLLWAVLERSIRDLVLPRAEGRVRAAADAFEFFWDNSDDPFSFVWICDQLNTSPCKLRRGIKLLQKYCDNITNLSLIKRPNNIIDLLARTGEIRS